MFDFSWVAALILLGLLTAASWLIRRAYRKAIGRRAGHQDQRTTSKRVL